MKRIRIFTCAAAFLIMMGIGAAPLAWGHDTDEPGRSIPVAKQDGLLEQGLRVVFVPVDLLNGILNAEGEFYAKGRAYKGEYARHGYYRTHARWYDTFLYHHEL